MDRPDYSHFYETPLNLIPPDDINLSSNTSYPNLNSKEYRLKPIDRTQKIHKFCERFDISEKGELILASNNIRDRIWSGSVWGFKNIQNFYKKTSLFNFDCFSPVTNLLCMKQSLFILSTASGKVQLWSSNTEVKRSNDSCLFLIGDRSEHFGVIYAMSLLLNYGLKAITGSKDNMKIWDMGEGDLRSVYTMSNAHSDIITGISNVTDSVHEIFVSCSRDKCATLWDCRQPLPASKLYDDHEFAFTSVYWSTNNEKNNEIILGDETGHIYCVDHKMPNKFLNEYEIYNRPIRKISFQGKKMAVLGNTNVVKAFKWDEIYCNEIQLIYENSKAENLVRDIKWKYWKENEFYTIDWDANLQKHIIK